MKTLIFEGAGWSKSDSSGDVGNCRIRTTFTNKHGQEIYLEMIGVKTHKWSPQYMKQFNIGGVISHIFKTVDRETSHTKGLSNLERSYKFEWSKAEILKLVNSREVGGEFDAIEVRDNWNGFRVDGQTD